MTNSLQRLTQSIDGLEELIAQKLSNYNEADSVQLNFLQSENDALKLELETLKKDYKNLQETSKEVVNELNNSIKVIEDYFKKQNANN